MFGQLDIASGRSDTGHSGWGATESIAVRANAWTIVALQRCALEAADSPNTGQALTSSWASAWWVEKEFRANAGPLGRRRSAQDVLGNV